MYRLNEVKNAQRIKEITVGSVVTTYVGNAVCGSLDTQAVWQIVRIEEDSSVAGTVTTTIKFPNGNHNYLYVWNDFASFTYV